MVPPPFETARALSDLYAFQCSQWAPIRCSQIIGRYKEIPVQRKHVDTKGSQPIRKYKEIPVYIRIQIPKADGPPHLKLLDEKVTATRFHTVKENPFETVNLLENIRKYQYI